MVDTTTSFIVGLFLLVTLAVIVGEIFTHLGQASLVGQLLVGVLLGPTLLGPALGLTSTSLSSEFTGLETLATFFILLMAGLSLSPAEIRATGARAVVLGVAIFFIPFLVGAGVVHVLFPGLSTMLDLFLALAVSITALPVLGIMLREFDLLDTRFGSLLLSTSVVNELSSVTVFAILLRVAAGGASPWAATAVSVATVLAFLATVIAVYLLLRWLGSRPGWKRWIRGARSTWNTREAAFALVIVAGLGAALYSQFLGLTFIIGAFYAGMLITPEVTGAKTHRSMSIVFDAVTWGFFIPLFFALVGYGTNFRLIGGSAFTVAAFAGLAVFAIVAKLLVGTGVSRSLGWSTDESFSVGFLVTSQGTVGLAMAVILLQAGIFSTEIFTIAAGVGLVTTIVAPVGAKPFITRMKSAYHRAHREPEPAAHPWVGAVYLPPTGEPERPPLPGEER
ncbi:MAG: cation:proton antiporter [Thermoplasmata archaeon]